jgi:hypothetical protein
MFIFSQTEGGFYFLVGLPWWLRQEIAKFETWDHEKASLVLVQKLMDDLREKPPVVTPVLTPVDALLAPSWVWNLMNLFPRTLGFEHFGP